MSVMNMPAFTAEDSLYKTSGHYQTGRHWINLPAQTIGTIHLAATKIEGVVGHEVITVEEVWPPDPWNPPSWGGHGGTSGAQVGGGRPGVGGGRGSGGGKPSKKPKVPGAEGCTYAQIQSQKAAPCIKKRGADALEGVPLKYMHYLRCKGSRMECCQKDAEGSIWCDEL